MLGSHLNFRLTKPSSAGASGSGPDIRQNGECLVKFSEDFSPDVNGVDVEDGTTIRCILMQKTVASEFSAGQGSEPPETLWDVMLLGTHLEDEDASTPKIELLRKLFLCSKGLLKGVPESSLRQVTPLPAEQLKKRLENLDTLSKGIKAFAAHVPFIVEQTERRALLEGEQSKLSQEQHDPAEVSNGVKGTGGKAEQAESAQIESSAPVQSGTKRPHAEPAESGGAAKIKKALARKRPDTHLTAQRSVAVEAGKRIPAGVLTTR